MGVFDHFSLYYIMCRAMIHEYCGTTDLRLTVFEPCGILLAIFQHLLQLELMKFVHTYSVVYTSNRVHTNNMNL